MAKMFFLFSTSDPHQISGVIFLLVCFLLPGVQCQNLRCFYCPQTPFNKTCKTVLSECAPRELCFSANGRFGRTPVLFTKGCMAKSDCVRSNSFVVRGNNVTFTYSCCSSDYCNSSQCISYSHVLIVTAIIVSVFVTG
ncbi:protein Bouncer [Misgurnus anguillicaudatus]|uniref:protein Bouncer n=1 Tax=Misgurnus anguillicaudatus TaxID=75329 RepID=UPI003CCFB88F